MVYRWYSGDGTARSWAGDGHSQDLEGQRILTYEDVLELEPESIVEAGYLDWNGSSCIYVETEQSEFGYRNRYWIAVENGLLVQAELWEGERTLYRMTAGAVDQTLSRDFALPDGTVLYQVD